MKCEYCGNMSGKVDARGNCVSCGASLPCFTETLINDAYSTSTISLYLRPVSYDATSPVIKHGADSELVLKT